MTLLPSPPQRDEHGRVIPHDHIDVLSSDGVIRRVNPQQHVVLDPKSETGKRISSIWLSSSTGVSVDLLRPIEEDGVDARKFVTTPVYVGSVKFIASDLRTAGFKIGFDPIAKDDPIDPENPYHGLLWGRLSSTRFKNLLAKAEWFVPIEGVALKQP